MVGAHASFTLSEETLAACVTVAEEEGAGIHVHVAEDAADEADADARLGIPVVARLAKAGALTDGALLAHCVHVHPSEVGRILDAGSMVAHNARSNMNNAVGRAPVAAFRDRTVLGTDGIGADMFAESQAAYFRAREDDVFEGPELTVARLANGARFAGRAFGEPSLGTVGPGAPADLVVLDYAAPAPLTGPNLSWHWVFALSAARVRDVLVHGVLVVADRRLIGIDQAAVAREAAAAAERLWARMGQIGAHPFEPQGAL